MDIVIYNIGWLYEFINTVSLYSALRYIIEVEQAQQSMLIQLSRTLIKSVL